MTGNPIFVRYGMAHLAQCEDWEWTCTRCKATPGTYGFEWTAGAAADAGREHMRRFHGYSRRCGVSVAACGAQTCRCDKSHVDALGGREKPAQRFEVDWFPAGEHHPVPRPEPASFAPCDRPDCTICATRNALQTTHNESREGC